MEKEKEKEVEEERERERSDRREEEEDSCTLLQDPQYSLQLFNRTSGMTKVVNKEKKNQV